MESLSRIHGGLAGAVVGALSAVCVLVVVGGLSRYMLPPHLLVAAICGAALIGGLVQRAMVSAGAQVVKSTLAMEGETTPYVRTFSHIDALEIRGDLDGAARAWAEIIEEQPGNALALVKAGDFHLRLRKDAATALQHYLRVRDLPVAPAELVRYSMNKIVDLHLGPLHDEGRALVALRRLIDRFPGTREADEARAALARLKAGRATD